MRSGAESPVPKGRAHTPTAGPVGCGTCEQRGDIVQSGAAALGGHQVSLFTVTSPGRSLERRIHRSQSRGLGECW